MKLDDHFLFSALCVFTRCTAMLLSAPILTSVIPVVIRVMTGIVLSFSLLPVLQPFIGPMPTDILSLVLGIAREAVIGLIIGGFLQILVASVQIAGSFMDVQIGTGSAQIFNPFVGGAASPISQFKAMLATVLILQLNGHRMMIAAFAKSFEMPGPQLGPLHNELVTFLGQTGLLSLQIAAPVAAVTIVIDLAAGIINKAVPQTQPFLLSLPAKLAAGIVVIGLGLPTLVGAVQRGLDLTFDHLGHVLKGS